MFMQEMTTTECMRTLVRSRLGRLACSHENQPYIVPIYFAYEESYLYGFTTQGQKVEWMRSNPLVCVEVDEIVTDSQWMSIIVLGRYEELPETEEEERWDKHQFVPQHDNDREPGWRHAHDLLQQYAEWWEPGCISHTHSKPDQPLRPVFYRIHIDQISGRRVSPGPTVTPSHGVL